MTSDDLAARLLAMAEEDARVRTGLSRTGALFDGYHPEMQAVHDANADALQRLVERQGWPDASAVGEKASEAAWLIAQHAIGRPDFMRWAFAHLGAAVTRGHAPAWQAAYLEDRIRTLEGRPQRFGTQFDWDQAGRMALQPIEDEANVDTRRAAVGLAALRRVHAIDAAERPPPALAEYRRAQDAWRKAVGWTTR